MEISLKLVDGRVELLLTDKGRGTAIRATLPVGSDA